MTMSKVRTGMLTTLLVGLGALGLAGCGGDTPTATPVVSAPTATTAVMEAPTATTGTMDEPTATAGMMEEATATTGAMEEPTATAGTSGTGDSAAMDILAKAGAAMKAVKTYHMSMSIDGGATGTTTAEGDLSLPDSYRMTIETAGVSSEVIVIGGSSYVKVPGGDQYIESPADASLLQSANAATFADIAQDAKIVGNEDIDGAATTHLTFTYDANAAAQSATGSTTGTDLGMATSDIWIDKSTNYIRQFKVVSEAAGVSSTTTIKYSKFDETIDPPIEKPTNIMTMPDIPTVAVP